MEQITIDLQKISLEPDNSIADPEIIRQIALNSIQTNDNALLCKIKKEFTFAGLYPQTIKLLNILPDNIDMNWKFDSNFNLE